MLIHHISAPAAQPESTNFRVTDTNFLTLARKTLALDQKIPHWTLTLLYVYNKLNNVSVTCHNSLHPVPQLVITATLAHW